jgi:hypothetical protein
MLAAPTAVHAGVVAACADGSVILAKKWAHVNCMGAVEVAPEDVPPIGSGKTPRTIAWSNFMREQEALRRAAGSEFAPTNRIQNRARVAPSNRRRPTLNTDAAPNPSQSRRPSLKLAADEKRDLALLVDFSQRKIPAALVRTQAGAKIAVMQVAHSKAFEAKLRAVQQRTETARSGPVLVFSLEPAGTDLSTTPLSFVQGGPGFHPSAGDPRELGWIEDGSAASATGSRALGYIVLPEFFDVSRPIAIFWGDAVVATTLRR